MADYQMSDAQTDEPYTRETQPGFAATEPERPWAAALGKGLTAAHEFISAPFGYDNPPGKLVSEAVGIPQAGRVMKDVGYGTTSFMSDTSRGRAARTDLAESLPVLGMGAKAVGKAAWEVAGEAPKLTPGQLNMFLVPGPRQQPMLNKAAEMEAHGAPPEQVWAETGMLRWVDGSWKYETDDSKAALKVIDHIKETRKDYISQYDDLQGAAQLHAWMKGGTSVEDAAKFLEDQGVKVSNKSKEYASGLSREEVHKHLKSTWNGITGPVPPTALKNVLEHPELSAEFPGIMSGAKLETFKSDNPLTGGQYKAEAGSPGTISLSTERVPEKQRSKEIVLHELQHLHDRLMGLDFGSSPETIKKLAKAQNIEITDQEAFDLYELNSGESLARLSSRRAHLSQSERESNYPMSRTGSYGIDVDPKQMRTMEDIYKRGVKP